MLKKYIGFLITEILYNGHLQSVGSASVVFLSFLIVFNDKISFPVLIIIYFAFQFVYYHDRYKGIKLDQASNTTRSKHLEVYSKYIPIIMFFIASVSILLSLLFLNIYAILFIIFIMFMGFLYPIYFKLLTKKIYFFKNYYVASVFSLLTFFPFVYFKSPLKGNLIIPFSIFVLIESLILQVILDCKDSDTDKRDGLKTVPALFGIEKTLRGLLIALLVYPPILTMIFPNILSDVLISSLLVISMIMNLVVVYLIKKGNKSAYIISAGKYVIWLLVLL